MTTNPFATSDGHQYFLEVEAAFNALRGSAALLSPADWRVVKGWRERGIPVNVVRAALENVFKRRMERGESNRVQSLSYCQSAVDNAFAHLKELGFGTHAVPETKSIEQRLDVLVETLGAFGKSHEVQIRASGRQADGEPELDPAQVERNLVKLEETLAEQALLALTGTQREALVSSLDQHVLAATKGLESRLDSDTLERTRSRTRIRLLKELIGHPALSLFSKSE